MRWRRIFDRVVCVGAFVLAASMTMSAWSQSAPNRVELVNGVVIAITTDHRSAVATVHAREQILFRSESAFLSLTALQNQAGENVGAAVFENWEDGYFVSVFLASDDRFVRAADFPASSAHLGVADWSGDGELDFSVPGPSGIPELFFAESRELVVYQLENGRLFARSPSCFPLLEQSLRNEVASLEGSYRSALNRSRRLALGQVELTDRDMARMPAFIAELRASIGRSCERRAVAR